MSSRTVLALFLAFLMVTSPVAASSSPTQFTNGSDRESDGRDTFAGLPDAGFDDIFAAQEVDGTIEYVDHPSGSATTGDTVTAVVDVQNTGDVENTFFVGYGVVDSAGNVYDNDETTGTTVTLDPGEWETVTVEWTVEEDAPEDVYDSWVALWEESDADNLQTRLDEDDEQNAFAVESAAEPSIDWVDWPSRRYTRGDTVEADVRVENVGSGEASFYLGFSVTDPNGNERTNDETTGTVVQLDGGEARTVTVEWAVPDDAPAGTYASHVAIWEETDPDELRTKLDDREESVSFDVGYTDVSVGSIETYPSSPTAEESVDVAATVENAGTAAVEGRARLRINGTVAEETALELSGDSERRIVFEGAWTAAPGRTAFGVELVVNGELRASGETAIDVDREGADGSIRDVRGVPDRYVPDEPYTVRVDVSNPADSTQEYVVSILEPSGIDVVDAPERRVTVPGGATESVAFDVSFYGTETGRTLTAELSSADGAPLDEASVTSAPETAGQIDVEIRDEGGTPVSDVEVSLVGAPRTATTDETGHARLTNVSTGAHLVYVNDESFEREYVDVRVDHGETATAELSVERGAWVSGEVSDGVGAPLDAGTIVIDGHEEIIRNGEFTFDRRFEPGTTHEIVVRVNGNTVLETTERLEAGENDVSYDVTVPEDGDFSTDELSFIARESFSSTAYKGFIFGDAGSSIGAIGADSDAYEAGSLIDGAKSLASGMIEREVARSHGGVVGLGTGLKETVEGVIEIAEAPIQFVRDMIDLVGAVLDDLGVLEEILGMIPQQIQQKQQSANPHAAGSDLNESFAYGYYGGYVTAFLAEAVVGSKGASKLTKATNLDEIRRMPNKKDVFEERYNKKRSNDLSDSFDDLDPDVASKIRELDPDTQARIQELRRADELTDEDVGKLLRKLDGGLGRQQAKQLLDFSFEDAGQFRRNIIQNTDFVDTNRLNKYIDDVDTAYSHERIENPHGLVKEAAGENVNFGQIRGQTGEARRAVRFAEDGADVTVEPGEEFFDLKVARGDRTEFVEVKTRAVKKDVTTDYVDEKIDDVSGKFENARSDPDVSVEDNEIVLEIVTGKSQSQLGSIKDVAREAINNRRQNSKKDVLGDKIRLVAKDGTTETISID